MLDRHRAALPSWLTLYYEQPIELVRGEGRHVWDADGNRYLDFFAGILTTISGHAVPEIVDALREQAGAMVHTSTLYLERADDRARRTPAGTLGDPRRQGVPDHVGNRSERGRAARRDRVPTQQPGARAAEQLPRTIVRHDRDHGATVRGRRRACPGSRSRSCTVDTDCGARTATSTTMRTPPRASRTCAT